jgi:hypothetical protein
VALKCAYYKAVREGIVEHMCVFITAGPSTKMFTWGGGGEDMCYVLREV